MPNQKSLTEFLTFLKNITRKSISKLDRVTNFRLLRSTETSLLIGWNLPMSLENNRNAFHKFESWLHGPPDPSTRCSGPNPTDSGAQKVYGSQIEWSLYYTYSAPIQLEVRLLSFMTVYFTYDPRRVS